MCGAGCRSGRRHRSNSVVALAKAGGGGSFQFVVTREPRVPFGPYLCAGTLLTIVLWDRLFNGWMSPQLDLLGTFILWLCLTMLGLMGVILYIWRHIKQALFR